MWDVEAMKAVESPGRMARLLEGAWWNGCDAMCIEAGLLCYELI